MPTGLHDCHSFLRYSKRTKVHLKIIIADRPTPVTRREKPRSTSTSASQPHVLARSSPHPLILLQAPIVAIIQVDIDDRRTRNVYCGGRAALSPPAGATRALVLLPALPPRVARCPTPRAPSRVFGSPLRRSAGLAEEEEEYAAVHGHRRVDVDEDV